MEIQLKELIDKIKEEGVGEADKKAEEIINRAKDEASNIKDRARMEAETIISNAKIEVKQLEDAGREALRRAGRDLMLNIKNALTEIFDAIVRNEVKAAFSQDVIAEVLPVLIREWAKKGFGQIDVLLSHEDLKKLEKSLLDKLSRELKKGIAVRSHPRVQSGFRIAEREGNYYYDFTDEGISENLVQYLNPVFAEIIKNAATGK